MSTVTPVAVKTTYDKIQSAVETGAPIEAILALTHGDDDMPDRAKVGGSPITDGQLACDLQGPPTRDPLGCYNGECLYKWRNVCGRTFYEVVDSDGSSTWYGPQGCTSCSP
jgi:hypothetical protein